MPKAHMYWTKKPSASHWGPSQKSGSVPGSSGKTYPPSSAAPSPTRPTFSMPNLSSTIRCTWFSSWSLVVVVPLLFLPSSLPVREENLLAETKWRLLVLLESGKRMWRRMGKWVRGCLVVLPCRIPPPPPPPPLLMVRAILEWMRALKDCKSQCVWPRN